MYEEKYLSKEKEQMNNLKKFYFIVVAIVVILLIIGITQGGTKDDVTTNTTKEETVTSTPEVTAYEETEITDDDDIEESDDETDEDPTPKPTAKPKKKKISKSKKRKTAIKEVIEDRILEEYAQTDIDHITINDNLGTKKKNDYIALVYLDWNVKNSPSLSREVISMYSEDLAATVGKKCSNVQEIAIFWTVPYLNDASAKCSYERKNGAMYSTDTMFDSNFD